MSILTRLTDRHLDDAALAELWTNAAAEGSDTVTHPHLSACAECRVRFASFMAWMQDLRSDATGDADEAFPAERLKNQQAQVLRRLEAAEHPTRILAFPRSTSVIGRQSNVHRWIAAAAAAGLVAGVGIGQLMDLRHIARDQDPRPPVAIVETASRGPAGGITPVSAIMNEEAALEELEAVSTPQYEALRAYDTFTPRAADFITPR